MFRFDCTFSNFNCTKRVQLHRDVHGDRNYTRPHGFQFHPHPSPQSFIAVPTHPRMLYCEQKTKDKRQCWFVISNCIFVEHSIAIKCSVIVTCLMSINSTLPYVAPVEINFAAKSWNPGPSTKENGLQCTCTTNHTSKVTHVVQLFNKHSCGEV